MSNRGSQPLLNGIWLKFKTEKKLGTSRSENRNRGKFLLHMSCFLRCSAPIFLCLRVYGVRSMFLWRVSSCRANHQAAHGPSTELPYQGNVRDRGTQCHMCVLISLFRVVFLKSPSLALQTSCRCTLCWFSSSTRSLSNSSPCAVPLVSASAVFTTGAMSLPETLPRMRILPFSAFCIPSTDCLREIMDRILS